MCSHTKITKIFCVRSHFLKKNPFFCMVADKRIRIKDIAKKAGVSTGTVDRVLHKRGKVSEEALERVKKAIDELGYEKNIIASTLAYNRNIKVGVILPNFHTDLYWHEVERGISAAQKKFKHFGVKVEVFLFDLFDMQSFHDAIDRCLKYEPSGVLFAPQFFDASLKAIASINQHHIPVVIINTYLESEGVISYIGQDSFQSGVLGARLLSRCGSGDFKNLLVLDLSKISDKGKHYIEKTNGFQSYYQDRPNVQVNQLNLEHFKDVPRFKKDIIRYIEKNQPDGIFVTNSRLHLLIDVLPDEMIEKITFAGFDLVEPNIKYLKEGKIDYLINQNAFQQGYLGMVNIVNYLVLDVEPKKNQYLPLDIVLPENYFYYTNNSRYFEFVM